MAATLPNYSDDVAWLVGRTWNSYLVKGRTQCGTLFSRDPLNLKNIHAKNVAGFANSKAVGISPGAEGGVVVTRKKTTGSTKPAASFHKQAFGKHRSNRKIYRSVATTTAKSGYRPDLRALAVSRASAILASQRPKKPTPVSKPRGKNATKAAAAESA
jgi:large subunit ribosomal protein L28e